MANLLDAARVNDELSRLDGWTGDTSQITKTVQLTDQQHDAVRTNVLNAADAMNHHPDIGRDADRTTFTLSTHSAGGVTELDVALAAEIDNVLRQE